MKKQSISTFYFFGTCLRYLQDADEHTPVKGDGYILINLNNFFSYLASLGLVVTERVAHTKLDELRKAFVASQQDAKLTKEQATSLRKSVSDIRTTLDAEIEGVFAYTPTPKRLDLEKLLSGIDKLFSPNVFKDLPEIARHDFIEAGKCIAYEVPTSAAFHILRGTESMLRHYYQAMIRQNRIKSLMWGPIVNDLRKRNKTKSHEALNNHLDHIRESFRNPTQHPEAIYDIHEVQDLFSICIDVVNRMHRILKG